MDFGEKMKTLRLERRMTLEQVGEIVGVGKSTVRKWESGQIANMRRDKIVLVAKALGVTPTYLMGWNDEPEKSKPAKHTTEVTNDELVLLTIFRALDEDGKASLLRQAEMHQMMSAKAKATSVKVKEDKPKPKNGGVTI